MGEPPPIEIRALPLLLERAQRLAGAGGRRLLGIAGAPGAGKSTLARRVVDELGEAARLVPMDGFHLSNAELSRLGRLDRKGAIDTFDAAGYLSLLSRLSDPRGSEVIYAPEFRREFEESFAGAIAIEAELPLVVTEGNYLLVDSGPWAGVRELLDESWFCAIEGEVRIERLIARHVRYGRSSDDAQGRTLGTDERNARLVEAHRHLADIVVRLDATEA
ncbi:MAG: nucleoside/nucleotide kinase family protein [Solirubrobacterales bacterium]|nr:nucleoside/nucleotide kinase family protein [Solirubrobacterales bacterium]